jgi:RES domain-containing protein
MTRPGARPHATLACRSCRSACRALDSEGARRYGGRWNSPGTPLIYTASTASLAALELLVHVDPADAPGDLLLMTIEIPDQVRTEVLDESRLPARWNQSPAPPDCRALGDAWLAAGQSCVLSVPAAPMPEERDYLLNPAHADFAKVTVMSERRFRFDPRL